MDIRTASGATLRNEQSGTVVLQTADHHVIDLSRNTCLYSPLSPVNIIAGLELASAGLTFAVTPHGVTLTDREGHDVPVVVKHKLPWLLLRAAVVTAGGHVPAAYAALPPLSLWHLRMAHSDVNMLRLLPQHVVGMQLGDRDARSSIRECISCASARSHKVVPARSQRVKALAAGTVHADGKGPFPPSLNFRYTFCWVYKDEAGDFGYVHCCHGKSEATQLEGFTIYHEFMGLHGVVLTKFYCDGDGAFLGARMKAYCRDHKIEMIWSAHDTPNMNATAERFIKTNIQRAFAMMNHAQLDQFMWAFAICYAMWVHNRTLCALTGVTPWEFITGEMPSVRPARVFGSVAVVHQMHARKPDPMKGLPGIMVGVHQRCWIIYMPATQSTERTTSVTWFENCVTREQRAAINWGRTVDISLQELTGQTVTPTDSGLNAQLPTGLNRTRSQTTAQTGRPVPDTLWTFPRNNEMQNILSPVVTTASAPDTARPAVASDLFPRDPALEPSRLSYPESSTRQTGSQGGTGSRIRAATRQDTSVVQGGFHDLDASYTGTRTGRSFRRANMATADTSAPRRGIMCRASHALFLLAHAMLIFSVRHEVATDQYTSYQAANFPSPLTAVDLVGKEPKGVKQALSCPILGDLWRAAMVSEVEQLRDRGTFSEELLADILRRLKQGASILLLDSHFVFKIKTMDDGQGHPCLDKLKARLVADGSKQGWGDYYESYAPVVRFDSFKVLMALMTMYSLMAVSLWFGAYIRWAHIRG